MILNVYSPFFGSVKAMKDGEKLPKYTEEIVCKKRLKRKYNEAQIDAMLSEKPRKRSRKWQTKDYGDAFKLLCNVGRKGYKYVRQSLIFQPGLTTLQAKFSFLSFMPGFIRHVFIYIQVHLVHTESWKNGHGRISVFGFDEVSLAKLAMYYQKFDCIIGKLP